MFCSICGILSFEIHLTECFIWLQLEVKEKPSERVFYNHALKQQIFRLFNHFTKNKTKKGTHLEIHEAKRVTSPSIRQDTSKEPAGHRLLTGSAGRWDENEAGRLGSEHEQQPHSFVQFYKTSLVFFSVSLPFWGGYGWVVLKKLKQWHFVLREHASPQVFWLKPTD